MTFHFETVIFRLMKLYLIRHAIAEERHIFGKTGRPDEERPLVDVGKKRMQKVAQGFLELEDQIDLILQSPLTRSKETVDVLRKFYPNAKVKTTEHLAPGHSAQSLYDLIKDNINLDAMALVGHEPDLGNFLSWLLFRQATDHFPFKKSGIAKLDLYEDDRCYLKWLARPKMFEL